MLQTEQVLDVLRRELRRVSPDVRIDTDEIKDVLVNEVIKREIIEGEKAIEASKKVSRAAAKSLRSSARGQAANLEDGLNQSLSMQTSSDGPA